MKKSTKFQLYPLLACEKKVFEYMYVLQRARSSGESFRLKPLTHFFYFTTAY